jgi:hypothetical protein
MISITYSPVYKCIRTGVVYDYTEIRSNQIVTETRIIIMAKTKAEAWTKAHDRALVGMWNLGESAEDISKKLNKRFNTKRTPIKCASRLTRIRKGVSSIFPGQSVTDPEIGRQVIKEDALAKWHKAGQPKEKAAKKDRKPLNGQTLESDRMMAKLYNDGKSFEDIAKAVTKKYGVKRTATQCRSRIGNIRLKASTKGYASKIRASGGRLRLTDVMLRIYHNMPSGHLPTQGKKKRKRAATKPREEASATPVSKKNGIEDPHKLKLDLGDGVLTVTLEGQFAKSEKLRDKAAKFVADAAISH